MAEKVLPVAVVSGGIRGLHVRRIGEFGHRIGRQKGRSSARSRTGSRLLLYQCVGQVMSGKTVVRVELVRAIGASGELRNGCEGPDNRAEGLTA